MQTMKISVTGNTAAVTCLTPVTAGTVGMPVEFTFDESWAGLTKTAVFRAGERTMDCLGLESKTTVPWELLRRPGCHLFAGVYGCNGDGSLQIPTVWADLGVILPGADPTGDVSADPSAPVWQQATAGMEKTENRVSVIDKASDDAHYPTAKAVCDYVEQNALLYTQQSPTEEQKAQARKNIGAAQSDGADGLRIGSGYDLAMEADPTVDIRVDEPEFLQSGRMKNGRVSFHTCHNNEPAILSHLGDGIRDDDAATVGQVKDAVKFVRLAETVLTEDAVEIVWTQTQDDQPLSDYKDFFIFWTGKFTADVSTTHATNSRFQCKGNGGTSYFSCQFPKKSSTENYAGWFYIEEIINDGKFALWRSQFPNAFLRTGNGVNIDYRVQGLIDACQTTVTDICCITNPAHTTLQSLHLGNVAESISIFAAGTKAVLYGRARI